MEPARSALAERFAPVFEHRLRQNGTPASEYGTPGLRDFTWALGSSLGLGYVVPTVIACRPHPPVWRPPSHFPAMPVIGPVFGIPAGPPDLPGFHRCTLQDCRLQFPPGDSGCAYPSTSIPTLAIMKRWEPLGLSDSPTNQLHAGYPFRRLIRSLSLRPSWLLAPWADPDRKTPAPLELLLPGFHSLGHPNDCRI